MSTRGIPATAVAVHARVVATRTAMFAAAMLALVWSPQSAGQAGGSAAAACKALEMTDLSQIEDAPTQVTETAMVDAVGDVPGFCHVQGYIAPSIGFELKLPASDHWNGKFLEIGCGGFCGSTRFKSQISWCEDALRRGYACIVSDQGHTSRKGDGSARDGAWAYNNLQAEFDYGVRAAHVAALVGEAITQRHYGVAPKFSYFMGCSGGGRQALVEAQRFPWDFDGIIAMDPALNLCGLLMSLHWNAMAVMDKDGKSLFAPADIELVHNAAIAKCDLDDGVKDGIVGDPPRCQFNPDELVCKADQKAGCLSRAQAAAAKKIYSGPMTSNGEKIFAGGAMPGAETGVFSFSAGPEFSAAFFRYMGFMPDPGPSWKPGDFDFDTDYKRLGMMETIYASNNPDLRKFKTLGGKLIIAQGWDDSGSPLPLNTIDYYETMQNTMGGRASTQEFARLFMIPGRAHCRGGAGANAIDFLSYLEAWVERGRAPDVMLGAHVESDNAADYISAPKDPGKARFTRPIYPYPLRAKYKGAGDPNDAANFESIGR